MPVIYAIASATALQRRRPSLHNCELCATSAARPESLDATDLISRSPRAPRRTARPKERASPARQCPCCGGRMIIVESSKARALRALHRRAGSGSTPHDRDRRPPCLATPLSVSSGRASDQTSPVLTTSADLFQAPRSRQALVCSRSKKLVIFAPTDNTGRLRPPQPHVRSLRDLQIPIGPAQPNRPPPPRGFLLTRLSNAGPPSSHPRLQRAGVRNPSAERT